MNAFWTWIRSIWSEPDGNGSSTRVIVTAIIAFILGAGISFAAAVHSKVITIEQFNSFLDKSGAFILTTCGPLYGVNKASDWLKNKDNKPGV